MASACTIVVLACLLGCASVARPRAAEPRPPDPTAALRLVSSLNDGSLAAVSRWMSPRLRKRVDLSTLERVRQDLRSRHGAPRAPIEVQHQWEGSLRWTSALWQHTTARGKNSLVLYQFAIDRRGRMLRLLVRPHRMPQANNLHEFQPITRFHVPARGTWFVGHGGPTPATNAHHGSTAQRFAFDLGVARNGSQQRRDGSRNRHHHAYGKPLLAPADGVIVVAIDGVRDNQPGRAGEKGGNGVVIDHGFCEYSALWHAIPGSIRVRVGERVVTGQQLGRVGNSGHSSAPHIHFHVSCRARGRELGLPAAFVDVIVDGHWMDLAMPVRGQSIRNAAPMR